MDVCFGRRRKVRLPESDGSLAWNLLAAANPSIRRCHSCLFRIRLDMSLEVLASANSWPSSNTSGSCKLLSVN